MKAPPQHIAWLALALLFRAASGSAIAATPASGIDCACTAVGQYSAPFSPAGLYLGPNGASASGRYIARLTQSFPNFDLEVTRVSDGRRMVFVGNLPQNTAFGFSPNGESFAYFSIRNQGSIPDTSSEIVELYNLGGATSFPTRSVWSYERQGAASVGYGFSRLGRYFVFTVVVGANTSLLKVIDTTTGQARLDTQLVFFLAPITDFSVAGWGFSRDPLDRSFVYAHTTGQTAASVNLRNLATGQNVHSRQLAGEATWRFSPCGDVFGLMVKNNVSGTDVTLVNTLDGSLVAGAARTFSGFPVSLSVNASSHLATVGNQSTTLAPNAANDACADGNTWVDFAYTGTQRGTFDAPYRTLAGGVTAAPTGGRIMVKAGASSETLSVSKTVTLEAFGGTVTIGQ